MTEEMIFLQLLETSQWALERREINQSPGIRKEEQNTKSAVCDAGKGKGYKHESLSLEPRHRRCQVSKTNNKSEQQKGE